MISFPHDLAAEYLDPLLCTYESEGALDPAAELQTYRSKKKKTVDRGAISDLT